MQKTFSFPAVVEGRNERLETKELLEGKILFLFLFNHKDEYFIKLVR